MRFKKIIILILVLFTAAGSALAVEHVVDDKSVFEVTTKDLVESSPIYEGRTVILRGEVIGDIMPRKTFAWINLQDQFNAVGVWAPLALTKNISRRGNYRYHGDIIEVRGIFDHADPEFGGEFCIRAAEIKVIEKGFLLAHPLGQVKINIAFSMLGLVLCLLVLRLVVPFKEDKERKES